MNKRILPTEDERRNGWDEETLGRYVAEREKAAAQSILEREPQKPTVANSRYNPHRWRRHNG